ncbi:MAG: hypothetical protein ACOYL5_12745 [Phototrophicaceae bacterium]|jgi:hypothetical protein
MMAPFRNWFSRLLQFLRPSSEAVVQGAPFVVAAFGLVYSAYLLYARTWAALAIFLPGLLLLGGLMLFAPMRQRLIGEEIRLRHLLHLIIFWVAGAVFVRLFMLLLVTPSTGKESQFFYVLFIGVLGVLWMLIRSGLILTWPRAYQWFSTQIPIWEQVLLALNESITLALTSYVWADVLVRFFQPNVFSTRINYINAIGVAIVILLYYTIVQLMWGKRFNDWLSREGVWLVGIRFIIPFLLAATTILVFSRFTNRLDPRTASLLSNTLFDTAVFALSPVLWLLEFVLLILVYTSNRGIQERFFPDNLLEHLPEGLRNGIKALSDTDILLTLAVLVTLIPVNLLIFGESEGIISFASQVILERGQAFIESFEQSLALLSVIPFYVLVVLLLLLYAGVISNGNLSADDREKLMNDLPVGFLIVLVITLYLFAIPFTQAVNEGRIPTFERDLGRILAFYVFVPLILLYLHFFLLVRFPYGRGQGVWRKRQTEKLERDLQGIDRRIRTLNTELGQMDNQWQFTGRHSDDTAQLKNRINTLHRYIQLNGERDDLNMQRLQVVTLRSRLTEISETPVSVVVARLPVRILSVAIPLLLLFQVYQWVILNEGLRKIVNNPNITVADFIRILLENINF